MNRSRFTENQIVGILKEGAAKLQVAEICREHGISNATYYHWGVARPMYCNNCDANLNCKHRQ